ncbi:helix-hairpin-helix domain-containing protein [Pasteurellaceae bacterium HPA106]|uniref:ComEA family DNA-binding protein n=1 Tax=Spirabiliibacterium pneumoniae TaxID=221400 RepID=UPI001AAE0C03|nr:ComEA family DNA-binding protein [Spirabiliibacterium pneumoniae]MBE2896421.1 helix-hairpin-helix domain-containing protein [Spirabiliibacterium pneumoniae]
MFKKITPLLTALCLLCSSAFISSAYAKDKAAQTPATQQNEVQADTSKVEKSESQKVHLNSATADELQQMLSGIGAKKAQAIVEYREQNGNFISIDQLEDVKGIGKATVDKNRQLLAL